MIIQTKKAFTLAELIIVIGILVILSSVGFSSYSGYLVSVRDANRISQLASFQEWLDLRLVNSVLILPDDYIEVRSSSWNIIAYQWYVWENNLSIIDYSHEWKDSKYGNYFSYYLTENKRYFQLMTFLEDDQTLLWSNINNIWKVNADIDYTELYIKVSWKKLWILTWLWDDKNKPIQEINSINTVWYADLSWVDANTSFQANFSFDKIIIKKGENIVYDLLTASSSRYKAPDSCVSWFIWVPWNARFNKEWFCVAKYEMTYTEADSPWTPNSTYWWTNWNSYSYDTLKNIDVRNDYPISSITQLEAINKCKSLWHGYHLITNDEWMTIVRNLESEKDNWTGWAIWAWFIRNGNSGDNSLWCTDNTWGRTYATKTWWKDSSSLNWIRTTCDEKRQLILTNWEIIWDFAWNLDEHVNKWNNKDWTWYGSWNIDLISWNGNFAWDNAWIDDTERSDYWSSELLIWTWTWTWIWGIYENTTSDNIFIRWWAANDLDHTGIYSLSLDFTISGIWSDIGFRCAK